MLSWRYINDRFLPDKAIDLIDEAGAMVQLSSGESGVAGADSDAPLLVTEDTVAEVLSIWTGVPVSKISSEETEKLMQLEAELHQRVIGQDKAVNAIARSIRRARVGLSSPTRPVASFVFSGPTGVGKVRIEAPVPPLNPR